MYVINDMFIIYDYYMYCSILSFYVMMVIVIIIIIIISSSSSRVAIIVNIVIATCIIICIIICITILITIFSTTLSIIDMNYLLIGITNIVVLYCIKLLYYESSASGREGCIYHG